MYQILQLADVTSSSHPHEHWIGASAWAPTAPLPRVQEYGAARPRRAQVRKQPRRDIEIEALRRTVEDLTKALAEVQQLVISQQAIAQQHESDARRARLEALAGPLDGHDELTFSDIHITEEEFQAMSEYDD